MNCAPWARERPARSIGFSAQIRYLMQLSDFFIGKPGPGSISEAMQQRLPVIVVRNAWTMPQERYNTDWVEEHRAGHGAGFFQGRFAQAVSAMTARLGEYRASVARIHNRAIFEIPLILGEFCGSAVPARIGVDFIQHFRAAERLHLSQDPFAPLLNVPGRRRRREALRVRQYGGEHGGIARA